MRDEATRSRQRENTDRYRKKHPERARLDALRTMARARAAFAVARAHPVEYERAIREECRRAGIPRWLPPLPPGRDGRTS